MLMMVLVPFAAAYITASVLDMGLLCRLTFRLSDEGNSQPSDEIVREKNAYTIISLDFED